MAHSNKTEKKSGTTRREFLKASTVAASAAVSGALSRKGSPSGDISRSVYAAGSDIIRVGMIG